MEMIFRPGTVDDAKACGAICFEAFKTIAEQHHFPQDFPSADIAVGFLTMVLSRPDVFSVVAEHDGQVVGSNFLWEGDTIAGVGPITVLPSSQNGSIGRQLVTRVLDRAHGQRKVGCAWFKRHTTIARSPYTANSGSMRGSRCLLCKGRRSSWRSPAIGYGRRPATISMSATVCA